jgi:tRNA modification GTPase
MALPEDTIAALATPGGESAIALIRITGPDTLSVLTAVLGRRTAARVASRGSYHDLSGAVVDDALFTFFPGPASYTGGDVLEISCHGSPYITQRILEDLHARGCRPAGPGEFTRRAFLNGRMDLIQAEAVMDVIRARGEGALAAAQAQLRGSLGRHMRALTEALLGVVARVEAQIDFPEEDLPPEDREGLRASVASVLEGTGRLLATRRYGELLRDGVRTVIVGEPNAGKSSLMNRLVGSDRAIVSPEPGTTRDFIEERVLCGAHCLRLIDTAGLNPGAAGIERLGVERTAARIEEADLLILVLDSTRPTPALSPELARRLVPGRAIAALNKSDLLGGAPAAAAVPPGLPSVAVSALSGAGCAALLEAVARLADAFHDPSNDERIAVNARHATALTRAVDCLSEALRKLSAGAALELLASDLRCALDAFGEISGKIDNERVLDRLFAEFCIGK